MNDTLVTLVGHVATQIDFKETVTGPSARFRFAVTPRYFDRRTEAWTDGPTSFYTVWARRVLAVNLASSVSVGEPLVVHGRLRVGKGRRTAKGPAGFRRTSTRSPSDTT